MLSRSCFFFATTLLTSALLINRLLPSARKKRSCQHTTTTASRPHGPVPSARSLSENQVKLDKDLRRRADMAILEFSGKTTVCHIKQYRKLLLLIDLILGQAPRRQ